jgi:hypothetical protein
MRLRHTSWVIVTWVGMWVATSAAGCSGNVGGDSIGQGPVAPAPTAELSASVPMRRLTHTEYQSSVAALFYPVAVSAAHFDLPPDAVSAGFDNNAEGISISDLLIEQYRVAAEAVTEQVFEDTTHRATLVGCDLASASLSASQRDTCMRDFIQRVGRMAYRRPLATDELKGLEALSKLPAQNNDTDRYAPAKLVAQALLQSPHFIFRVEVGQRTTKSGTYKLTGYEVATRMAYLLTTRGPDDELLAAAERGELDEPQGIEAQGRRLLYGSDEAARAHVQQGVQNFYTQWLNLGKLNTLRRESYVAWTPEVVSALRTETTQLVDEFVWNEGRNFLQTLTAPYTYLNNSTATFYGHGSVTGSGFQQVALEPSLDRPGLLGRAAVIAANTKSDETAVIFRGKFIANALLCQEIPPPDPADAMAIGVDRMSTPKCAACHQFMDKVGSGFARFNAVGLPVANADSVSNAGVVQGLNEASFQGISELAGLLVQQPVVTRCVVSKLLTFGEGKQLSPDAPEVGPLYDAFVASGQDLRALYLQYMMSDRFRYRVVNE